MPVFEYTGTDRAGNSLRATVEAESAKSARSKVKKNGVLLLSMTEKGTEQKKSFNFSLSGRSVNMALLSMTTRQFASLIKANIPLVEALNALVDQTDDLTLKGVLSDVRQQVNEGTSLKNALATHPKVFPAIFVNMVESGEASGTLPLVLLRLADFMEYQVRLRGKVASAMAYPLLMLTMGGGIMLLLFTFVIPKIASIFSSMNKALPWYTEMIMNMSNFIVGYWPVLLIALFLLFFGFRRRIATPSGKAWLDRTILKLPIFGPLARMVAVSRFASTLSTLLTGGVPIVNAFSIVRAVVNSAPISDAIAKAQENITEGQSIAEPLRRSGEFPQLLIHMISIGERTGELPQMLEMVAQNYEEQVNTKVTRLTTLLEPLMIVVMGVIVGIIVLAIFMPLLQLQQIQ
jgi:general secretion pathway protein F